MEIVSQTVKTKQSLTLPGKELWVMPIGDVQCGVPQCDEDRLRRHMEWGLEHDAYFLGMGDYVDMSNPTDRRKIRSADLNDSTTLALTEKAERDLEKFRGLIDGSKGRWLGFLQGHHYIDFGDGTTTDTRLADEYGAPYLGDCAIVDLKFQSPAISPSCRIFVRHGAGSSGTEAGALTKVYKDVTAFDADIYLHGHYHRKVATKKPRMYVNTEGELRYRNQIMAVTGSFLRSYMQGGVVGNRAGGTYPEVGALPPVTLGGILLKVRPVVKHGQPDLDLDVEL
jgi:hypothetical protein